MEPKLSKLNIDKKVHNYSYISGLMVSLMIYSIKFGMFYEKVTLIVKLSYAVLAEYIHVDPKMTSGPEICYI